MVLPPPYSARCWSVSRNRRAVTSSSDQQRAEYGLDVPGEDHEHLLGLLALPGDHLARRELAPRGRRGERGLLGR
jgi:hypothetical protein